MSNIDIIVFSPGVVMQPNFQFEFLICDNNFHSVCGKFCTHTEKFNQIVPPSVNQRYFQSDSEILNGSSKFFPLHAKVASKYTSLTILDAFVNAKKFSAIFFLNWIFFIMIIFPFRSTSLISDYSNQTHICCNPFRFWINQKMLGDVRNMT